MPRAKKKKPEVPAASRGLDARRLASAAPPASVTSVASAIEDDGGTALATYRDPLGGHWQILAALPIDRVEPTPYQRDLSEAHVERLAAAIDKLDRFLDPVIAVPAGDGKYWSPNGYHRLGAMSSSGAKSIVALVVPEQEVAHRILLLNTEKAHNLRERALEVARLGRGAGGDGRPARRREFATAVRGSRPRDARASAIRQNGRFAGGAFHPVSSGATSFSARSFRRPSKRGASVRRKLLELNDAVNAAVASAEGARVREPVPQGVRRRAHQPAALPAEAHRGFRRDDRQDDRVGEPVRRQPHPGRSGCAVGWGALRGVLTSFGEPAT